MKAYRTSAALTKGASPDDRTDRRTFLQAAASAGCGGLLAAHELSAAQRPATTKPPLLGVNLAHVHYWTSERPFQNLFLTASKPVSLKNGGKWGDGDPLQLDANGWIEKFPPNHHAAYVIDLKPGHPKTTYELTYDGPPNALRFADSRETTVRKGQPDQRLLIEQYAPVSNVVLTESGTKVTQTFAEPFLERCRKFRVLRMMNWGLTCVDREVRWDARTTPQFCSQAEREVALEYMVELCNLTDSTLWYCVHHRADDDYVRNTARRIKELRKGKEPIYLEHSNEVWNAAFRQFHYCQETSGGDWLGYHIRRTAEIARIFRKEGVEVISVLGMQSVAIDRDKYIAQMAFPDDIDATAIAPYFGGDVARKPETHAAVRAAGVEGVLEACAKSIEGLRTEIRGHRELADRLGLQVVAYEGGQHLAPLGRALDDPAIVNLFVAANQHPDMYQLYKDYLRLWDEETDSSLMCLFESVSECSKWGCWGLLEYEGQDPARAHKYRAVLDYLAENQKKA